MFFRKDDKFSVCNNESFKCFFSKITPFGPVMKLKNLLDVHLILLGAVENDFELVTQKKLRNCERPLKLLGEKN